MKFIAKLMAGLVATIIGTSLLSQTVTVTPSGQTASAPDPASQGVEIVRDGFSQGLGIFLNSEAFPMLVIFLIVGFFLRKA